MPTELKYLTLTALLAACLWMPYIYGVATTEFEGKDRLFERPLDNTKMVPWVHRSFRAHLNLLEQLLPLAIIVLTGHLLKVSTSLTAWGMVAFFWLRIAHAIVMISGYARFPLRTLIYLAGWLITLALGVQLLLFA